MAAAVSPAVQPAPAKHSSVEISSKCLESLPEKHIVKVDGETEGRYMTHRQIRELLTERKLFIAPHYSTLTKRDIEIDEEECSESDPCVHTVKIDGRPAGQMDGVAICALYNRHRLDVPDHFAEYNTKQKDD